MGRKMRSKDIRGRGKFEKRCTGRLGRLPTSGATVVFRFPPAVIPPATSSVGKSEPAAFVHGKFREKSLSEKYDSVHVHRALLDAHPFPFCFSLSCGEFFRRRRFRRYFITAIPRT